MNATERAAVAEALTGNIAVHVVYCVRETDPVHRPDPFSDSAVPVCREMDGSALARGIGPDSTLPVVFDGLRVRVALPPLATAILPLIDGRRNVGQIGSVLADRGAGPDVFSRAWRETYTALEGINHLLLAPAAGDGTASTRA